MTLFIAKKRHNELLKAIKDLNSKIDSLDKSIWHKIKQDETIIEANNKMLVQESELVRNVLGIVDSFVKRLETKTNSNSNNINLLIKQLKKQ